MSKTWGAIGAWAAESERAEAEEAAAAAAAASGTADSQSFPSLKEAASAKPKKKKMTLSEFTMGGYATGSGRATDSYTRLTPDEMLRLPTGPKERSAEEMQHGRLGGGFSSYGRPERSRDRDDSWGGGNRRSYGGFDDEQPRRGPSSRGPELDQPSRADEVDNWAMNKKPFQSLQSQDSGRQNRYGGLGSGGGGGFSRADEVDNWTAGKKTISTRSSTFGSSFRNSGPEPDRWARGGFRDERTKLNFDPPKLDVGASDSVTVKTDRPNPFGAARPREQVLADKGVDYKKLEMDLENKKATTSRPTSSHSSRPSSAQSSRSESQGLQGSENVVKPSRPKVNPFGDAKPREVLLEERGQDWRKIDLQLEHRRTDRPESEEEKKLKEEIDHLKEQFNKEYSIDANRETPQGSSGNPPSLQDIILHKEQELKMLIRDLDSKVRFGPKPSERPGSGAGRAAAFPERPPSQSGSFDESRSMEFMDRPRSRGRGDAWTRPGDDRRAGGRDRGFLGSRDFDRQRSREGW
ncbi:hypothetical protein ACOSQ2_018805 [Xanthoceras sorbifolium]|uniref:Eukaryotic translation initiation factor 4B2 n=1 Tax=Xanthoceras sorbifolium TaxID=99658 RepID=A0ABQ8I1M2_9ROSI|nr:hypothetical protein JRO89_XS05G0094800 [Xanthoceras sorbifolium]